MICKKSDDLGNPVPASPQSPSPKRDQKHVRNHIPSFNLFKIRAKSIDHPLSNNQRNRSYGSFIWTCTCIPTAAILQYKLLAT